jgi:hypothetical protein
MLPWIAMSNLIVHAISVKWIVISFCKKDTIKFVISLQTFLLAKLVIETLLDKCLILFSPAFFFNKLYKFNNKFVHFCRKMNKKNMHINETKHFSTLKYKIRFFYIIFF